MQPRWPACPSLRPGSSEKQDELGRRSKQIIDAVYDQKSVLYVKDKTAEEWEQLMRMHILLGMIFEKQRKWGSSGEPRSAIFQYENALRVQNTIAELRDEPYVATELNQRLGAVFQQTSSFDRSFEHLEIAVLQQIEHQDFQGALATLKSAEGITDHLSPDQRRKLAEYRARAEQ